MAGSTAPTRSPLAARWSGLRQAVSTAWAARQPRERLMVGLAAAVLGLFLLWSVAIAPAWRSLRTAPARLEQLEAQL
jgi:general secretion pathway protein M